MGKSRKSPPKAKVHSLLDHYRQQTGRHLAAIEINDPYGAPQHKAATLVLRPGRGAENPDAPREWLAPRPERIKVMASTRDTVTGMYARRQIDNAMFHAARAYQRLYERAGQLGHVRSVDLSAPQVSGRLLGDFEYVDMQLRALHQLQQIDAQIEYQFGEAGVGVLRDVLGRGVTIENTTKLNGDGEVWGKWWGGLFRHCLKHLAEITGFAVKNAYRNLQREGKRLGDQQAWQERKKAARRKRVKESGHVERGEEAGTASPQGGV